MGWRKQREVKLAADFLAMESAAFLNGTMEELYESFGLPIPGWVRLNRLTHGDEKAVRQIAATSLQSPPAHDWQWPVIHLARELVELSELEYCSLGYLQLACLLPVEMAMLAHAENPFLSAAEAVGLASAALQFNAESCGPD